MTSQIGVGHDLLAVGERDHRAVDRVELTSFQRVAQLLAPPLHGVPAGMFAEHERRLRHANFFWPHDLVGPAILEHAVLMDAGFVRKRVPADNRLVRLNAFAGERGQQLARGEDLTRIDAGGIRQDVGRTRVAITNSSSERVPGALADPVDRAFHLSRPALTAAIVLATASPRSSWQCALNVA